MADTSYLLFGQEYTESQGRMMARVFEELLNRRPDLVPEALRQFPCLAAIDYTQNSEALRKARPAFLNKRTFQAGGRRLCIGTSYNLSQKRAFISRLFQLCGEDEGQFVPLEGPSDPENTPQPPAGERRPPQEPLMYRLFDQVYQSNQTAMMYRAFYEILGRKPELIDWAVEHLKCVKDLTGPRSGEPVRPTSYFQTQRFLEVNDRTLCLGTACNLKAKQRLIDRLLCQAGFSEDVFQIYDSVPSLHLRSWQKEAAEAAYAGLFASLRSSGPAGILSIPAGAGKTIIMAELLRRLLQERQGWSVLVLSSTSAVVQYYTERFRQLLGGAYPVYPASSKRELADMAGTPGVTIVSTIHKLLDSSEIESPASYRPVRPYSTSSRLLVIAEEASSYFYGQMYLDMRHRFPNAAFLGITSVPSPSLVQLFGPVLYTYSYRQAYQDGLYRAVRYEERLHWEGAGEPLLPADAGFSLLRRAPEAAKLSEWIAEQEGTGRRCALLLCENVSAVALYYQALFPLLGPGRLRTWTPSQPSRRPSQPIRSYLPPEKSRWDGRYFSGLVIACSVPFVTPPFDAVYLNRKISQLDLVRCLSSLGQTRAGQSEEGLLVDLRNGWARIRQLMPEDFPLLRIHSSQMLPGVFRDRLTRALARRQYHRVDQILQEMRTLLPEEEPRLSDQLAFLFPPSLSPEEQERRWQQHQDLLSWQSGLWLLLSQDSTFPWEPPEPEEPPAPDEAEEAPPPPPAPLSGTPQERGEQLELAARELIAGLFAQGGGYELVSLRKQTAGTQFGFDVIFTYLDSGGVNVTCAVECKNYQSVIGTGAVTEKLSELQSLDREIEHWILISPNGIVNNSLPHLRERWMRTGQWYPILDIQFWTPDEYVSELFRLFPRLYAQFYQSAPGGGEWSAEERQAVFEKWRKKLAPVPRLPQVWKEYLRTPSLLLTQYEADPDTIDRYQALYQRHAPIRLLDQQEQPIEGGAEDYILRWLQRPDTTPVLLLGDFGDGKSFFTYVLARKLADAFWRSPRAGWIPLRLSLRDLGDSPLGFRDFLVRRLQEFRGDVSSWNDVNREYRFLIMLDGLDEMSLDMSDAAVLNNLAALERLMEQFQGNKLLVTSRKMAVYSDQVRERILYSLNHPEILHLAPVAPKDRIAFLEQLADTPERRARLLKIRSTYDLMELAAKPLFLDMMRVQLDGDDIQAMDASGIYQSYAEAALSRNFSFHLRQNGDCTHPTTVRKNILFLLEELALCLQQSGTDSIGLDVFKAQLPTPQLAELLWENDRLPEADAAGDAENRLTNRSLLKYDCKRPENRTFCHRSMREYFLGRGIARRLRESRDGGRPLLSSRGLGYEVLKFAGEELRHAAGRPLVRQRLTDFAHASRGNWDSPWRESLALLGTNSVNLLHTGGFGLPGEDWSGLLLDYAALSGASLSGKNFSGSSMRYAHLDNADLSGCDLRNCDFTGVQFEKSGQLLSFAVDGGAGTLLACYRDGKLRRWQTGGGEHQTVAQLEQGKPFRLLLAPGGREGVGSPERFLFWQRQAAELHTVGYAALRPGLTLLDAMGNAALIRRGGELCLLDTAEGTLLWRWEFSGGFLARLLAERIAVCWSEDAGLELTDLSGGTPAVFSAPLDKRPTALAVQRHSPGEALIALGFEHGELRLLRAAWSPEQNLGTFTCTASAPGSGKPVLETAFDSGEHLYAAFSSGAITRYRLNEFQDLEEKQSYQLELKCTGARIEGVRPQEQYELLRWAAGRP